MEKVIFIDRDGVINRDPGGWTPYSYVTKWEEFFFIDGSVEALKKLKDAGYKVFLISNQGGISKGYFTEKELAGVSERMLAEIRKGGGDIDRFYYCPHHDKDNCDCRKPKTGLIEKALREFDIALEGTYIIGDSIRDIEAGSRMGMKTALVLSGKTSARDAKKWHIKPDLIKKNLLEAVNDILADEGGG